MRIAFVEEHRNWMPVSRLCRIMDVGPRGYRAWRRRPMSRRQRQELAVLAHIREQFRLSPRSYGRPRMTEELKELGLDVGHRRVGRLMRENGIAVKRNRKFKATTDSNHSFNIAPNLLGETPLRIAPTENGPVTSATSGPVRAGSTWLSSWTCIHGAS